MCVCRHRAWTIYDCESEISYRRPNIRSEGPDVVPRLYLGLSSLAKQTEDTSTIGRGVWSASVWQRRSWRDRSSLHSSTSWWKGEAGGLVLLLPRPSFGGGHTGLTGGGQLGQSGRRQEGGQKAACQKFSGSRNRELGKFSGRTTMAGSKMGKF